MRCNAIVVWEDRRKKGSGEPIKTPRVLVGPPPALEPYKKHLPLRFEAYTAALNTPGAAQCDGKIICSIEAVDELYYGGSSAALEVGYKCNKCGNTSFWGVLPTDGDEIAGIVTKAIEDMK